jgi:hypothetical protein
MPPYKEKFPVGSRIRILDSEFLSKFKSEWRYHNPLTEEQMKFAGTETTIESVGYYHGGDVLYSLHNVPGIWHETCLELARPEPAK